ncbi:MAG: AMP-binding protein [Neisseria sp.]|uniref:AMP-binding protein n=1 Tax=Neisseria sp. TaxID=192066 RepID=UPI0026DDAD03|nr:AMP-binding protein [Neisseria sp.]MDO4641051.1 AMP-binding protein [Neisseria sp.]
MNILNSILMQAENVPDAPAVILLQETSRDRYEEEVFYSYSSLVTEAKNLAKFLLQNTNKGSCVGIVMGNTPEWVLSDIALLIAELTQVPVPLAFSYKQAEHLLHSCDIILADELGTACLDQWKKNGLNLIGKIYPITCGQTLNTETQLLDNDIEQYIERQSQSDSIIKIIHTSGTTSQPKGVKIRRRGLDELVTSLWQHADPSDYKRYLSLVPLSLLIEQVTALYIPLTSGGAVIMPPSHIAPLGSPGVKAEERLEIIRQSRPSALTLTPALVEALADSAHKHEEKSNLILALFGRDSLPLLAAGGAPVSSEVLHSLDQLGITVYQGYGLSENSSVATWNHKGANRIGTVGKPLSHVEVKISEDNELYIRSSSLFAGYTNEDPSSCLTDKDGWLHTGDLAIQDDDGFISILGRKKSMIIMANGRNISPEWLESAYRNVPGVLQVIVFGDKQQFLSGIFIIEDMSKADMVQQSINNYAEKYLNEIEHITEPIFVPYDKRVMEKLFTITGRPRRDVISSFIEQLTEWR